MSAVAVSCVLGAAVLLVHWAKGPVVRIWKVFVCTSHVPLWWCIIIIYCLHHRFLRMPFLYDVPILCDPRAVNRLIVQGAGLTPAISTSSSYYHLFTRIYKFAPSVINLGKESAACIIAIHVPISSGPRYHNTGTGP